MAGSKSEKSMMLRYGLGKPTWRKFDIYSVPIGILGGLRSDVVLSFRPTKSTPYDFPALAMGKVIDALTTCIADLRKFWNIDDDEGRVFSRLSTADVRTVFRSDDYPLEAHERGQEGTGQFLLMVDEKGKIVGCTPIKSSGIPVFDVLSCGVIKERAKATPALDMKGKGVRSTIVTPPITFRLA